MALNSYTGVGVDSVDVRRMVREIGTRFNALLARQAKCGRRIHAGGRDHVDRRQ